jgi:hypothetical protein
MRIFTCNVKAPQSKYEPLHFFFVAQLQEYRTFVISRQIYPHRDTFLPRRGFFEPRFTAVDYDPVWMGIQGYIN